MAVMHDDVIKWKHFPRYWPFVRGIHRSPVNSPHKGQWRWALMFSLICVWINGWINNREAGDLRSYRAHYAVTLLGLGQHSVRPRHLTWWHQAITWTIYGHRHRSLEAFTRGQLYNTWSRHLSVILFGKYAHLELQIHLSLIRKYISKIATLLPVDKEITSQTNYCYKAYVLVGGILLFCALSDRNETWSLKKGQTFCKLKTHSNRSFVGRFIIYSCTIAWTISYIVCQSNQIKFISLLLHVQQYNKNNLTQHLEKGSQSSSAYVIGIPGKTHKSRKT